MTEIKLLWWLSLRKGDELAFPWCLHLIILSLDAWSRCSNLIGTHKTCLLYVFKNQTCSQFLLSPCPTWPFLNIYFLVSSYNHTSLFLDNVPCYSINKTSLHPKREVCYIKNVTYSHQESQLAMTADSAYNYCEIVHDKVSIPPYNLILCFSLAFQMNRIAYGILSSPSLPWFIPFSFPNRFLLPLRC